MHTKRQLAHSLLLVLLVAFTTYVSDANILTVLATSCLVLFMLLLLKSIKPTNYMSRGIEENIDFAFKKGGLSGLIGFIILYIISEYSPLIFSIFLGVIISSLIYYSLYIVYRYHYI